ncbi:NACHT domain-containing NTPase [Tolypothrix bouteillei VB521301_2]|uniref:NACHT domain-containing protein n=1 Tax=Tolypothrix bouteillei TaxID=1246981 RepID=UPI0038B6B150
MTNLMDGLKVILTVGWMTLLRSTISILGEFGTGKTWFALHYAWVALTTISRCSKTRNRTSPFAFGHPLRDYAKAVSVESLFSEFFSFDSTKFLCLHITVLFVQLNRMGKLLLIFDGFDEMASRVDRQRDD